MYKVSGRSCSNGNVETPEPRCYIQMPVLDEQPAVHCGSLTLIDWKVNERVLEPLQTVIVLNKSILFPTA